MAHQLGIYSPSSISHLLVLLILLPLLHLVIATQEAAAASGLDEANYLQSPSWLHSTRHWLPGEDSDDGCQPPMLWAPVKGGNRSGSAVNQQSDSTHQATGSQTYGAAASSAGQGASASSSGEMEASSSGLGQDHTSDATEQTKQLEEEFTCKDYGHFGKKTVDWFIVIKEHGTFNYVYATSENTTFSNRMQNINTTGPLRNTLKQTNRSNFARLFYSYTSFDATPEEGHQNGVLLFGEAKGFWLIHSWRRLFEYFRRGEFPPTTGKTKGQAFICTTHKTEPDLENIGKQLFITKPRASHNKFDVQRFPTSYWTRIVNGAVVDDNRVKEVCENKLVCIQPFTIGSGVQLIHFSKSGFADTVDIYDWIAIHNGIDGISSCLMVQTWQSTGNVRDVGAHSYPNMQETSSTKDHSKWCIRMPLPNNTVLGDELKVVCIGDLNRGQTKRPGGAMCLWNAAVWQYFKTVSVGLH